MGAKAGVAQSQRLGKVDKDKIEPKENPKNDQFYKGMRQSFFADWIPQTDFADSNVRLKNSLYFALASERTHAGRVAD